MKSAVLYLVTIMSLLFQDKPPDPKPTDPMPAVIQQKVEISFPKNLIPAPQPAPVSDDGVAVLLPGQLYLIQGTVQFFVLSSPAGKVVVNYDEGPLKFKGNFVDGTGIETRTIPGPFIATVEVAKDAVGRVELICVPVSGIKVESDIPRMLIDIGAAPQPPPKPVVPIVPVPDPTPVTPAPVTPAPVTPAPVTPVGFRVIFGYDTMSALTTREKLNSIYSTQIVDYLNAKVAKGPDGRGEWRKWSFNVKTDSTESKAMVDLWNQSKPLFKTGPQLIIAANGKAEVFDVPNTEAETLALLKKYGG